MGLKPDLHAYREFARAYRQAVAAGAVPRGQPVAPNQISATITAAEALGITHATAKYRLSQAAHFHTKIETERGFANGSLAGYSQYARDIRAIPDAARQWLLFMHPERRVSQRFDLQLSDLPKRKASA